MASIFKAKGARKYTIEWTDENGRRRKKVGTTDRGVSARIARDLENKAALRREGLIDPAVESHAEHEARPLAAHLAEWEADLLAKGATEKHVRTFTDRARRVAALVNGGKLADIDAPAFAPGAARERARATQSRNLSSAHLSSLNASRVQTALGTLREQGRSLQTCNHYRAAIRAFVRWAWREGRVRDYPLARVTGFNVKEDLRHDRRTLSVEELKRLIDAAHRGEPINRMTGPVRALCYRLAVATGLRFSEIKSITPESFDFGTRPCVVVSAAYTKNGEIARQPLPPDLAADLSAFVADIPSGAAVFPLPRCEGASMLRIDMEAAGIPYQDDAGRVFDFHSLRCQCATLADQAGVSPRVVQRLMRHSSLDLTNRYTRPRAVDIENAASALPSLRPDDAEPVATAATGTDPGPVTTGFTTATLDDRHKALIGKSVVSDDVRSLAPRAVQDYKRLPDSILSWEAHPT